MSSPDPSSPSRLRVSIVVPLYNEAAVIRTLLQRLGDLTRAHATQDWELVCVDDGSSDPTCAEIAQHGALFPGPVILVELSRNFGHQPALMAGLQAATGDAIICMDADLQDPPDLIPAFLARFAEGYDVVYGVRESRHASPGKLAAYRAFYRFFNLVADRPMPLDSGDFGLVSARVAKLLVAADEKDLLLRGLRSWVGFRQIGVPYDRPERELGETKYSWAALFNLAGAAFFGFSTLPLRLATGLGGTAIALALGYTVYALYEKLVLKDTPAGWASQTILILFMGGVQLMCVGIMGEYVARIHRQLQRRPLFIVREKRQLEDGQNRSA